MRDNQPNDRPSKTNKIFVGLYLLGLFLFFMADPGLSQMEALSDADMEAITAQSGVSLAIVDYQFDWAAGYFSLYDSDYSQAVDPDDGAISFTGLTLINGVVETKKAINWDAYTIEDTFHPMVGQTFVLWQISDLYQHLNLAVDDVVFCGQSIGQLAIDSFTTPEQYFTLGAHGSGVDFQYDLQMHMDRFGYTYNTSGADDTFELSGIHLVGTFEDMANFDITDSTTWDIPMNPSGWTSSGVFSIGDIDSGNPAAMDIGTDASGQTVIQLELPMSGSLRVEGLNFGNKNFGPLAIDGLQVHRLTVTIPGSI